jgi:myo-inositol-1(or 4)-monophosphatase
MNDPSLSVAIRAARNAAAVIQDAARDLKHLPGFSGNYADIVTRARRETEDAIAGTLAGAFPSHAIVGEGGAIRDGRNATSNWRWIVDPIDGTRNFTHGYPYYAISLALMHGTEITHAVVLDPVHDELFTAIKARGAQLNGVQLRVSACTHLEEALVGTIFPTRRSRKLQSYAPSLAALMARCAGVRRAGACSLDLAYVAAGRLDGFWVMSLKNWDVAAGALLVTEAGGRVGDFAGGTDFLKGNEVIAAAPGIFVALREAIVSSVAPPAAKSDA